MELVFQTFKHSQNMIFSLIFVIALISCFKLYDGQHINSNFHDNIPIGNIEMTYNLSLVSTPLVDFLNNTAVTLTWILNTNDIKFRITTNFDIEISYDHYSDDFVLYQRITSLIPEFYSNSSFSTTYTIPNLQSEFNYRFRICPVFIQGRGECSFPLAITTLADSVNYWEPILSRRSSLTSSGRGFSNPVLQRPHLDFGVEMYGNNTSENPLRYSDPVTSETPVFPVGRRGHSLSQIGQFVYMFGGRSNGYSCASIYKDTINLGNQESGRDIYPCTHFQSEVHELWSFDISTYQWIFLNTSKWQSSDNTPPPSPREKHSAIVINGNMFIYGGKTRIFQYDKYGKVKFTPFNDIVYGDLWKLNIERPQDFILNYTSKFTPIPQNSRLLATIDGKLDPAIIATSDADNPRNSLCIDKVIVKVIINHPCFNQIKVSILGPGPQSGSPNFFASNAQQEVILIDRLTTNDSTGCISGSQEFQFHDDSNILPESCCPSSYSGIYKPQGKLAEYIGSTMASDWTLVIQDLKNDSLIGELIHFSIVFTSSPCFNKYLWTNLTYTITSFEQQHKQVIPPRSGARTIAYENSFFIYGGRDQYDSPLNDLWRFDTMQSKWTMLSPVNFDVALYPSSSIGANFVLTTWGLIRFGGYYRQPFMPEDYSNYDNSIAIQDPITLRWNNIILSKKSPLPYDSTFGRNNIPSIRYLSSFVFISSHVLNWETQYTHCNLYNQLLPSHRSNSQGSITDSLLLFGGFDGATGSIYDGSSGGYLNDLWMLRLTNYSTLDVRYKQQNYLNKNCKWRKNYHALKNVYDTESCLSSIANNNCEWRDLLLLSWCSMNNQTIT